ncbi:hypothetical protein EKI60_01020 [Candidatus Saccharibacteria bacterium]|nr:MAG: hypothetical protein EKI60_01020 [Candidatus Saccharibacteria bacterium]
MKSSPSNRTALIKQWLSTGSINIFGIPFSGKDTQCQRLAEVLDAASFGGGDILRSSQVSAQLTADINQGKLAPTEEYLATVVPYFARTEIADKPLVLSSVGRWSGEENSVIAAAQKSNHPIKATVWLKLDQAEALKRLHAADRGRDDDHEAKLATRMQEFAAKTVPVLKTYEKQDLLIEIDGTKSPEQVTEQILNALAGKATQTA